MVELIQLIRLSCVHLSPTLNTIVVSCKRECHTVVVLRRTKHVNLAILARRHTRRLTWRYCLTTKDVQFARAEIRLVRV